MALVGRSGRPLLASAVGGAAGALTCWSVFAATALRRRSTWFELRASAVQQVAPRRAADLRAARHHAVARSAGFVYGLAHWDGPRTLAGHSTEGDPPRVTSVELGHGDLSSRGGPWVVVDTAERRHAQQHTDARLADDLWDAAYHARRADPSTLVEAELVTHVRATWRARAARSDPLWQEGELIVDGQPVPVRWARDEQHWVARVVHGDLSLAVRAYGVPLTNVSLNAVHDLDAYASL